MDSDDPWSTVYFILNGNSSPLVALSSCPVAWLVVQDRGVRHVPDQPSPVDLSPHETASSWSSEGVLDFEE